MNGWDTLLSLLPDELVRVLRRLPPSAHTQVQELRLRAGQAVALGIRGEERYVTLGGAVTVQADAALWCEERWLRQVTDRVCEHSVYAHQEELKRGFLPAPGGCRIGIAGTAVVENGEIVSYRNITSLCMRVAREHHGCAAALAARPGVYNRALEHVASRAAAGAAFVIRPGAPLPVGRTSRSPEALRRTHALGQEAAIRALPALRRWLDKGGADGENGVFM